MTLGFLGAWMEGVGRGPNMLSYKPILALKKSQSTLVKKAKVQFGTRPRLGRRPEPLPKAEPFLHNLLPSADGCISFEILVAFEPVLLVISYDTSVLRVWVHPPSRWAILFFIFITVFDAFIVNWEGRGHRWFMGRQFDGFFFLPPFDPLFWLSTNFLRIFPRFRGLCICALVLLVGLMAPCL